MRVQGYGNLELPMDDGEILLLDDVAHCPPLLTTIISLRQLRREGFFWDTRTDPTVLQSKDGEMKLKVEELHGQYVLEYRPRPAQASISTERATLITQRLNSRSPRKPLAGDAIRWHHRLGHPGPQALEHLVNSSQGTKVKGPLTHQCDACGTSKLVRQVSRAPRNLDCQIGERIGLDFHDYEEGYEGYKSQLLAVCRISGYIWDYYLVRRTSIDVIRAIDDLMRLLMTQFNIKIKRIECDNEIYSTKQEVKEWLARSGIVLEPSAPYTQAQNGAAERAGGVIKTKGRAMRTGAKLPEHLWPEISKAAVYLHNRIPSQHLGWKSPRDILHTVMAKRAGVPQPDKRPNLSHLRVYGCKAYAMTTDAMKKAHRRQKLAPRAWIGYLVGYFSSNIYRIWIPHTGDVISTRDVIFNEDELLSGDKEEFRDELRTMTVQDIKKLMEESEIPTETTSYPTTTSDQVQRQANYLRHVEAIRADSSEASEARIDIQTEKDQQKDSELFDSAFPPYPSPPPSVLLTSWISAAHLKPSSADESSRDKSTIPWQSAFLAGRQRPEQIHKQRELAGKLKIRVKDLPMPPRTHTQLQNHPKRAEFEQAEKDHLQSHQDMNSWTEIDQDDLQSRGKQVLGCMWVYTYKSDQDGFLVKCKARLVVRGDQEAKGQMQDTYAATLAGRSFRTLLAIAARDDLEMDQYDVVNAFVHATLEQDVYMRFPPGHHKQGKKLRLNKALYGLRISPLLWQKELTRTLVSLGMEPIPHEPCCFKKDNIYLFFYVDDMTIIYPTDKRVEKDQLAHLLQSKYKISGGEPMKWFLGLEVTRDRPHRRIWLNQTSYISKIAALIDTPDSISMPGTPMSQEELLPSQELATPKEIQGYQRKIGSLLYAAVSTRPDIAFAVSRLGRFASNPSSVHHKAANRVLAYLLRTKQLGLRVGGGGNSMQIASDASFADNTIDRKSSQGYAIKLFGGLIGWRANKQDTVTTSTTEAELLALGQAAKEGLFLQRLLNELTIKLDKSYLLIDCDNQRTIHLVHSPITILTTKLRHVDIHHHWLRQEVQRGKIRVEYVQSDKMIADGLTKALPPGRWEVFLQQLGLEKPELAQKTP